MSGFDLDTYMSGFDVHLDELNLWLAFKGAAAGLAVKPTGFTASCRDAAVAVSSAAARARLP